MYVGRLWHLEDAQRSGDRVSINRSHDLPSLLHLTYACTNTIVWNLQSSSSVSVSAQPYHWFSWSDKSHMRQEERSYSWRLARRGEGFAMAGFIRMRSYRCSGISLVSCVLIILWFSLSPSTRYSLQPLRNPPLPPIIPSDA